MSQTLELPRFDIPALKEKKLSPGAIYRWMDDNFRMLQENGALARALDDPARKPVDARFVLWD